VIRRITRSKSPKLTRGCDSVFKSSLKKEKEKKTDSGGAINEIQL
jgi:hypothetical protein